MAVDAFIWFVEQAGMQKIKGETKDDWYKAGGGAGAANGSFEIKDFSFEVENLTTVGSATGGAGGGKAKFMEFNITKLTDAASPAFFRNCVAGAHYKTVHLHMRKAGGDPNSSGKPFLKYIFGLVFTTKIGWDGPGDEGPTEKISFAYGTLEVEYIPQLPDGTMGQAILQGWSQITNKAHPP